MKRKLLFGMAMLFAMVCVRQANAYTTSDLTSAGWESVTSLSDVNNYFYVFVDASAQATAMGRGAAVTDKPRYIALADPVSTPAEVWVLEKSGEKYSLKSLTDAYYLNSAANGWQDFCNPAKSTADFTFTLSDGKYQLSNTGVTSYNASKEGQYVGPWTNLTPNENENIACNKNISNTNGFYIYSISRTAFLAKYLATASSASPINLTALIDHAAITDATPTGWSITRNGGNPPAYDYNLYEVYNATSFTLQQTVSVIPGTYQLGVYGFYRAGGGGATATTQNAILFAGGAEQPMLNINSAAYDSQPGTGTWSNVSNIGYVPNNMQGAGYAINTDGKYANTLSGIDVPVGSTTLTLGVKRTAHIDNDWTIFNKFSFFCTDVYISALAIKSFTSGNTMDAEQWYSFTVPTDGDYTLSATSGIVYVVEDQLLSAGVNNAASTIALKAGTAYFKSTSSQALTITYVDPVVANGDYYLYDANSKMFLSRGNKYGTEASLDDYGVPFTWNNYSKTIRFLDWSNTGLFHNGTWFYTDGGTPAQLVFVETDGGLYLRDAALTKYVKKANSDITAFSGYSITYTETESEAVVWTVKTKAEHDAIVAAYPIDNRNSVITNAGLTSETNANDFETWLSVNRAAKDMTSSVSTYNFDANAAGSWTWTQTESRNGGAINYADKVAEAYLNAGYWTQDVSGLKPGIYKVTVNAFERAGSYATCNTLGAAGWEIVTAYFEANGQKVQLKSWYSDKDGTNNPDNRSQAYTAFYNDKYKNTLYTYVSDGGDGTGTLTLKVAKPSHEGSSWVLFNNITLTYYDTEVSDDDAAAILTEANKRLNEHMKASLWASLNTAKETFDDARTVPNYSALRTAIDATETSVASYNNMYTNYLSVLQPVMETTNFVDVTSEAYITYKQYLDAYNREDGCIDVENATANALSVTRGSGTNYTSTYSQLFLPNWKIDATNALTNNSGFYVNSWSTENAGSEDAADFANPFFEEWIGSGSIPAATLTGTLTGLTANTAYSVTAKVRVQGGSKVAGSITMEVVGGEPVDVTAGSKIGDTDRYIKSYTATGVTDADGNLVLKFNIAANSNISWLSFRDVNYAESDATISNDFTDLNAAIATAETHTLGFENGEYAPYNNITGIEAIATAKAFDKTRYYIPSVISDAESALSSVEWTANDTEVNAFYDGDFSECAEDNVSPLDYTPNGWTASDNMRTMLKNAETYPGLAAASATSAMMSWSGGITYGETTGYTMPLKANSIYKLSFKASGWNNETRSGITVSVLNSTDGMAAINLGTPDCDIKGNETNTAGMTSYETLFATGAAGNYVFHVQSGNNFVITDLELKKADNQYLEITDDGIPTHAPGTYPTAKVTRSFKAGINTLVLPFAMSQAEVETAFGSDSKVYIVSNYDAEKENITFATQDGIVANRPCLLKAAEAKSSVELANRSISVNNEPSYNGTNVSMIGSYAASTTITKDANNYIVYDGDLYYVASDNVTAAATRAYITVTPPAGVKSRVLSMSFDDEDASGIAIIEDGKVNIEKGIIYNLNGQRVVAPSKGIYIVNGKKVLFK